MPEIGRTELTRLKKQATAIAELQNRTLEGVIGELLQQYIQDNIEVVLSDYVKLKKAGKTMPEVGENQ